jgi:hypothetical protein
MYVCMYRDNLGKLFESYEELEHQAGEFKAQKIDEVNSTGHTLHTYLLTYIHTYIHIYIHRKIKLINIHAKHSLTCIHI